jgi:2-oxoglutarate/2-oxoacid ferredoxin oxidoreductase subunit beta
VSGVRQFPHAQGLQAGPGGAGNKARDILLVSGNRPVRQVSPLSRCNTFNGIHGRALPVATGVRLANPDLKVVVTTGDGDCYGEGGNHLLAAFRRNPDMTLVVHNNQVYALTKGQASPTSDQGFTR